MIRRVIAVTVATTVLLSAGMVARADALDQERTDAVAELTALAGQVHDAAQRTDYLTASVEQAEWDVADREAVLALRPAFVAEVGDLVTALELAEGKIYTAAHRASALSAQQAVVAEKGDPDTVTAATATVRSLTAKVSAEVTSWESAQAAQSAGPGGPVFTTSGPDGYARVRAALDLVGGGGIGLYESSSCAGGTAPACANSNGYIKYRADIAGWSPARLNWAMAHELAHIYQFRVWGALNASGAYGAMFGGDPEFLANCMAVVRGYPGSVGCNGDQQAWASGIWVGAVR
ncbi:MULTISPECIES: hypothetical protein [unclassified Microbacterium]|uniref:hypothetical protein n=1 Tax=unclassified Microbacterium TaxID=2609290 RepID=UPI000EAAB8EB|nr:MULTISPECIES: hypothetical protein [unclassified Microbacterium]MBT2484657.1 hypothetical protein [Microbacterium sp. ISL-108]RKN67547.1 hypothetical protein D7252_08105 [Microbacterium sp. CGR2]